MRGGGLIKESIRYLRPTSLEQIIPMDPIAFYQLVLMWVCTVCITTILPNLVECMSSILSRQLVRPTFSMSRAAQIALLPPAHKIAAGDTLNKDVFTRSVNLLALCVKPQRCKFYMDTFRDVLLNMPRLRNIIPDPESNDSEVCALAVL
jgi:hypothetical protein